MDTPPKTLFTRRHLLQVAGSAGLLAGVSRVAQAQHDMSSMPGMSMPGMDMPASKPAPGLEPPANSQRHPQGYLPVRTLKGWTLPYTKKGGVKEYHLVAEEIEHEYAHGSRAKCWGYNGTPPGPTIEVVAGDCVRLL